MPSADRLFEIENHSRKKLEGSPPFVNHCFSPASQYPSLALPFTDKTVYNQALVEKHMASPAPNKCLPFGERYNINTS